MARAFTPEQLALLKSPNLKVNVLATFFLDEGTYRFCDENSGFDLKFGADTYIGANALFVATEVRSGSGLAAEPVTISIDGNRMAQVGIQDPAAALRDILGYLYQQRRVNWDFAFRYANEKDINLIVSAFAGKINSARLIDREVDVFDNSPRTTTILEIVLDSLAARYGRATYRLRSHNDQLEIDPTDQFYSFTVDVALTERNVLWGRGAPMNGSTSPNIGGGMVGAGPDVQHS